VDLYTLTDTFLPADEIDEFVSAIWTERYSSAGDVQIVLPALPKNIEMLQEGKFLALRGTKEIMQLETQSIENGLLTVVGTTLITFLNERYVWAKNPVDDPEARIVDYTDETKTPGQFISDVVTKMVITPVAFTGAWADSNLDWANDAIPHLTLGAVDASGVAKRLTAPIGPLYDSIQEIADKEGVGISMYLDSADEILGYSIKFKTYQGLDRTSGQDVNELVKLSPDLDSLSDLKEVRSISGYKNVAYVYYKGKIYTYYADPDTPVPEGFARRVLITDPDAEPPGHKETHKQFTGGGTYTTVVVSPEDVAAFLEQNARDALANHNYIQAVDGQTSPIDQYQYGVDYGLGDVIELEGLTGTLSKARVTEHIRSQDQTGEKSYPTISVITT
jgi:hypothetical protein